MAGSILNMARRDIKRFTTAQGFEENITLQTPDRTTVLQTTGLSQNHWISFVTDGLDVDAKSASICLSMSDLTENNYPFRNSKNNVDLTNHRVDVVDASGNVRNYVINQFFPNETFGIIPCILGDFSGDAIPVQ